MVARLFSVAEKTGPNILRFTTANRWYGSETALDWDESANQMRPSGIQYLMVAILRTAATPTQADFHAAISSRSDRWYAACLKITRNRDMAEDAVQDALLNAWNKRHQFDSSARLDTWIHRIAINSALQQLRKNRPTFFEPLDFDIQDQGTSPEAAHTEQELGANLTAAMTHLSEIERVCFVLKHLEQWRLKEIADEINTTVGTVKQAIFRAVRKLRPRMGGLQGDKV